MPTVLSRRPGGGGGTGAGPAGPTGATGPTGTGGGLPTGWTEDGDPANVDTHGGGIALGEGELSGVVETFSVTLSGGSGLEFGDTDAQSTIRISTDDGVDSTPAGGPAFTAHGDAGASSALDANGLSIQEVADPTDAQDAATKNYVDTAHVAAFVDPSTGSAEDIANALIAAGLMAPS